MTNEVEWARATTQRVGAEIRRLRGKARGAQWLSDRTAELGHRVGRSRISDLERGDRGGVLDVAELVVLARALDVAPLELVFPLGREAMTEVLPGTPVPTWLAAKWFTNEGPFPQALHDGGWGASTEDLTAWKAGAPLLFRKLDTLYAEWAEARREAMDARDAAATAETEKDRERAFLLLQLRDDLLRRTEDNIRSHREFIRLRGLDPGEVSPEFAHLDDPAVEPADHRR